MRNMVRDFRLPLIVLGVFTLVGIGLGLSGSMILSAAGNLFLTEEAGQFATAIGQMLILILLMAGIMMTFFTGPTVGAVTGLHVGSHSDSSSHAIGSAAVGSFIGFLIMTVVAVMIMITALPEMGGGGTGGMNGGIDVANYTNQIVMAAIPTTIVGGASAWFGFES